MPNEFSVQPLGGFDIVGAAQRLGDQYQGYKAEQERDAALDEAARLFKDGTPADQADFLMKHPEVREHFESVEAFKSGKTKSARSSGVRRILSGEDSDTVIDEMAETITSAGGDPSDILAFKGRDEAEVKKAALQQLIILDPKAAKAFIEADGGKSKIGTVSPKDFTVESLSVYEKTGNVSDLKRYMPKTVKIAGIEHQQDPITLEWKPIVDMTGGDISTQAAAGAEIEADKQSRLDFAKQKSSWNAGKSKYKTRIAASKAGHERLKKTGELIKNNLNKWTTSYGASLKGLSGTDARKLEGLLNSLRAHSAFSTLTDLKESGGTLGAISAPELTLLEAKLGTLDQRGDIEEQIRVVDQIIDANQGSIDRLEAAYADDSKRYSGSYDQSISEPPAETQESETAFEGVDLQAYEWAKANPDDPRSQDILNKLGVN